MLKKLASRKFLVTIVVAIVTTLWLDVPVELLGMISAWILGQSYVDAKVAERGGG